MRKSRTNSLLVGDTVYSITEAYRNGARACRAETPFWANPHRDGSQRHADWAAGHDNEAAGLHRVDVIEAAQTGTEFVVSESGTVAQEPAYQAYTTRFDEVVRASDLVGPDEIPVLRGIFDRVRPKPDGVWDEADKIHAMRILDRIEGTFSADRNAKRLLFLIDNSGSMRGRPIGAVAGLMAEIGNRLDRAGVRFEVLGFTTASWKGGRSREDWILNGRPESPGRLCDLRHLIYRDLSEPWNPDLLLPMLKEGLLKENVDGEALLWAADRARQMGGAAILHLTDGPPMDQSTLSVNPEDYLERHFEEGRDALAADPMINLITIPVQRGDAMSDPREWSSEWDLSRIAGRIVQGTVETVSLPENAEAPDPRGPEPV